MHPLSSLACLEITGADRKTYLQGQLSNDLGVLSPSQGQLTCCSSPQGRVQAILRLIEHGDSVLAIVPSALKDLALQRLRRYVLRAKVRIEPAALQLFAAERSDLHHALLPVPEPLLGCAQSDSRLILRWNDLLAERWLVITPSDSSTQTVSATPTTDAEWQAADIRAGLPQVLPTTHESFVAQMLNLDLLHAISFNKGCYTGQEIIARAHYRGTVKRRLFRFSVAAPAAAPGTRVLCQGEHAGEVVNSAGDPAQSELLAVISLAQQSQTLHLETHPGQPLTPLTLPYAVD